MVLQERLFKQYRRLLELLAFVLPDQAESPTSILRHYAQQDTPDELGAQQRRLKVAKNDPAKGTSIGYVAK